MSMRLIGLAVALTLTLVFSPLTTEAQQSGKLLRIGFLSTYSADFDKTWRAAFKHGLRDLGYVEGRNIVIDERHAQGRLERLPELAAELVRHRLDVFVVHGAPAVRAAGQATSAIPIVFADTADPIGIGSLPALRVQAGTLRAWRTSTPRSTPSGWNF
jgi:putative tryptophan/tyrosine transport system substrate-binding protein